jgi:DNA-directed RNA polymerase specialized sigma subunit
MPNIPEDWNRYWLTRANEDRDRVISNHMSSAATVILHKVAVQQCPRGWPDQRLDHEDLISIAAFTLLRAVPKFDPEKGPWGHHLSMWARAEMQAYLPCFGIREKQSRTGRAEYSNMGVDDDDGRYVR